jgi:hypothetical protein
VINGVEKSSQIDVHDPVASPEINDVNSFFHREHELTPFSFRDRAGTIDGSAST